MAEPMDWENDSEFCIESYIEALKSKSPISKQAEMENFLNKLQLSRTKYALSAVKEVLRNFICSEIVAINFGDILKLYPEELAFELLELISTTAFGIRKFSILVGQYTYKKMTEKIWREIGKMHSLTNLEISNYYYFPLQDLMDMCAGLQRLTYLRVAIDAPSDLNDPALPDMFKRSFGRLKTFFFTTLRDDSSEDELTMFCIKHLQDLQEVNNSDYIFNLTSLCQNVNNTCHLKRLNLVASMIEDVEFDDSSIRAMLPDIEVLHIEWHDLDYRPIKISKMHLLLNFSKLNTLQFEDLEFPSYLRLFLDSYGKNLINLDFNTYLSETGQFPANLAMKIDLNLVQELCPNLNSLTIIRTKIQSDVRSMIDFTKLEKMFISFSSNTSEVCLSDFLSPPALKQVDLRSVHVTLRELQHTVDMVKRKEIMSNIESLNLGVDLRQLNIMDAIEERYEELVDEVLKIRPGITANFEYEN